MKYYSDSLNLVRSYVSCSVVSDFLQPHGLLRITDSESLSFELVGFPRGIQMFHPRDMEKKVRAFPGNTAQGKKRRWQAGCCLLCIPIGPLLRRISMFQPRTVGGVEFQERSEAEVPVT